MLLLVGGLALPLCFGPVLLYRRLLILFCFPSFLQVITLDTAGANYRSVWAMHKHFPHIKTFVRAFDIENGAWPAGAGATAVTISTAPAGCMHITAECCNISVVSGAVPPLLHPQA